MRPFFIFRNIFLIFTVAVVSSCASMGSYMTNMSNKNPDAAKSTNTNQKCDNWCHNGWCSTHCDGANSSGN